MDLQRTDTSPMLSITPLEAPEGIIPIEAGSVTTPQGFKACGVHAGFRSDPNRLDMALVCASTPVSTAGVFTQNCFCAAPVRFCQTQLDTGAPNAYYGSAQAVIINSGNANAATGAQGFERARETATMTAEKLSIDPKDVLVCSTGVIGVQLSIETFNSGLEQAKTQLSFEGGHDAARAIMTTDTYPKTCGCEVILNDAGENPSRCFIGAMTKGSGMIMPNMATMIAIITTDAALTSPDLHRALKEAVAVSFNKVTVDSDTSTNDTCIAMASGLATPDAYLKPETAAYDRFVAGLTWVCQSLARTMAADGEGATRLLTVRVSGAATSEDADLAARSVANSPLVKTAIYGHDANWGRIAEALGKSGARFSQGQVAISLMGMPVCAQGLALDFDEEEALRRFEATEILIEADLGAGDAQTTIWSCDLSHEYVRINGDYRS